MTVQEAEELRQVSNFRIQIKDFIESMEEYILFNNSNQLKYIDSLCKEVNCRILFFPAKYKHIFNEIIEDSFKYILEKVKVIENDINSMSQEDILKLLQKPQ